MSLQEKGTSLSASLPGLGALSCFHTVSENWHALSFQPPGKVFLLARFSMNMFLHEQQLYTPVAAISSPLRSESHSALRGRALSQVLSSWHFTSGSRCCLLHLLILSYFYAVLLFNHLFLVTNILYYIFCVQITVMDPLLWLCSDDRVNRCSLGGFAINLTSYRPMTGMA